eukprot:1064205_1
METDRFLIAFGWMHLIHRWYTLNLVRSVFRRKKITYDLKKRSGSTEPSYGSVSVFISIKTNHCLLHMDHKYHLLDQVGDVFRSISLYTFSIQVINHCLHQMDP